MPISDRAVFVSIGEYLLSGDRLYVDLYDNKDPLFFYAVAVQRSLGPFAEYLFELLMVAITAVSAYDLSCTVDRIGTRRKKILLIAVPLLITGIFWIPGYTTLPGTALSLLACALFLRGKTFLAGGCIGLVAFTKLIMLPLPSVFCFTYELILWNRRVSRERLGRTTIGFVGASGIVCSILIIRQELLGYLLAQQNNFLYANGVLIDNSTFVTAFASHLRTMFTGMGAKWLLLASLIASMGFVGYVATRPSVEKMLKAFLISSLVTSVIAILILGLTGIWKHHLSLMYVSQTLLLIGIATGLNTQKLMPSSSFAAAIVACAILLSGTFSWRHYVELPTRIPERMERVAQDSPESTALMAIHPTGTAFARLGKNNHPIPYGAPDNRLLCPEFSQYHFYSSERFDNTLDCAKKAPTIVVDEDFVLLDEAPSWWPKDAQKQRITRDWNNFVTEGETILQSQYTCKTLEKVRVCDSIKQ
ncbi:MAG: hypothetical protein WBD47_07085 [Phormidesmis sp.]